MVHPLSSLRGSSAEALQDLGTQLESGRTSMEKYAELGGDLFSVAALVRSEPALRRTITDVSVTTEARSALITGILEGKVGAKALDLVASAAAQRWVSTRDLADSLEHLGVIAVVKSAGARSGAQLSDELFSVAQAVDGSPELGSALSDPLRSQADKTALLHALFGSRVLPATLALADQAMAGSYRSFSTAVAEYQKVAAATNGEGVALVSTAKPLSTTEQDRLAQALSKQYARPVHLTLEVDPSLIGGLRVEIGDDVIDGTVLARLDEARRRLAG